MYLRKNDLISVLKKDFGEAAKETATYVLNIFGFHKAIPDTLLDRNDRKLFNDLLDAGILKMEYAEVEWHELYLAKMFYYVNEIPYWVLEPKINVNGENEKNSNIYEELPNEIWERK